MSYLRFDGSDHTMDSGAIEEQIDSLIEAYVDETEKDPEGVMTVEDWQEGLSQSDAEELVALIELRDDASNSVADWDYDALLISLDFFPEYVEEFVSDVYNLDVVPDFLEVDWEETADNLREDYMEFEFRGTTYLGRV